jgi:hypothetical protein
MYEEALREPDEESVKNKMAAAEMAITARLQELAGIPHCQCERKALAGAVSAIRSLRRERLKYPRFPRGAPIAD